MVAADLPRYIGPCAGAAPLRGHTGKVGCGASRQTNRCCSRSYRTLYRMCTRLSSSTESMVPWTYASWSARVAAVLCEPSSSLLRRAACTVRCRRETSRCSSDTVTTFDRFFFGASVVLRSGVTPYLVRGNDDRYRVTDVRQPGASFPPADKCDSRGPRHAAASHARAADGFAGELFLGTKNISCGGNILIVAKSTVIEGNSRHREVLTR